MIRTFLLALAALLVTVPAHAHEEKAGDLVISHPWTRATASSQKAGAVFMKIVNHSDDADRLIGAASPDADVAEVHGHTMDGDVMRMRRVDGVDVPAEGTAVLAPGGYHIMLIGLKAPLFEETTVPLTLKFEHAGEFEIEVIVESPAYQGSPKSDGGIKPGGGNGHGMHK